MKMAFIFFDNMTMLDFAGFHNAITWLKKRNILEDLSWDFCGNKEEVTDDRGMIIRMNRVMPNLGEYDLLFVPGGQATRQLIHDQEFVRWIQTAQDVKYKVSVCTGALILGAAGFTKDKIITTNPLALAELIPYCKEVVKVRAIRDGDLFTGGGITASVDLGLYFIETITDQETAVEIQKLMDYPYYRPQSLDLKESADSIESRLHNLGITLPEASDPAARYANCVQVNNLLFVSGKGPSKSPSGRLGQEFNVYEGYQFARDVGIEILSVIRSTLGSLEKVKRVVKIQGFVNAVPDFEEHHKVLNGCSELMLDVFGAKGEHARSVFGAVSLRDNLPVIIDSIFEVDTLR